MASPYPQRKPDLDTPKLNIWKEAPGAHLAEATITIDGETEEPFESRVYACIVPGYLLKVLAKTRISDKRIWYRAKLVRPDRNTALEAGGREWVTRPEYYTAVKDLEALGVTTGRPTITDGRSMLRSMQEASTGQP